MNLLARHSHTVGSLQPPATCTCLRAACGAAESGPGITPSGCTAHHGLQSSHMAIDCPALPADTDLSRLWILVTRWTSDGPVIDSVAPYDRARIRALRQGHALWDLSLGDDPEAAARAWQDQRLAANAEAAQVARIAQVRSRSLALVRRSGQRAARRNLPQ
ncbi:hypothetical protein ACGFYQ_33830 [Streptomyces sp. NPDC048258]|uniref:hypothetical protein n=1 Tax=Streptomyces sp. NPDC048258 TaxID=3365527 RepID=UPI00371FDD66